MFIHYSFVALCLISEVVFVVLHRSSSTYKQLLGMILIPVSIYFFTYQYPLFACFRLEQVYAVTAVCLSVLLILFSLSYESVRFFEPRIGRLLSFVVLSFILISFIYGIPWLIRLFPLENPDAILFTLFQNNAGVEGFVWDLVWRNVLCPTLLVFLPVSFVFFVISIVIVFSKKTWCFSILKYKLRLFPGRTIWQPLKQLYFSFFCCSLVIFMFDFPKLFFPLIDICNVYLESNKKSNSQLYLEEYVFPDSVTITFPAKKKNLIFIMMESMEVNFKDYTPEINELMKNNISFSPGGVDLAMTNWTMAAQISKLCAIPLNVPYGFENSNYIYSFLPHAKCLMDILADNGYKQIYFQGSDGSFSSKRTFWTQHNVKEFHDYPYFKQKKIIGEKKEIYWGVTDKTLYRLIQNELAGGLHEPFAMYMMTVDTHFPDGYLSEGCVVSDQDKIQYPSILRCSSKMLDSFLGWIQKQNWYENTVVVVVGDHTWDSFTESLNLPKDSPLYWINLFMNVQIDPPKANRKFSSFDIFPTVLESMNAEIEGHRLGLGTSLFSREKTLLERFPQFEIDSMLKKKSYQYDFFMQGGNFKGE